MLVSVIIPVFNVAPYLEEALNSVLHQTYPNLEIIIIDDGSTDGSGGICDEFAQKDERIRIIHQENRGLSSARNVGLDLMTGDAVAFLDSDDAFDPSFVTTMVEAMDLEKTDVVICKYTNHHSIGEMSRTGKEKLFPTIGGGAYDRVKILNALVDAEIDHVVWNKLYCSSLWQHIRFPEGHVYEDVDTTYRVFNICKRILIIDDPLYLKRKHKGSITGTWNQTSITDYLLAHDHLEEFVSNHIPDVFSFEQEKKFVQARLRKMMICYAHYSWHYNKGGREPFGSELRQQIADTGRRIGVDGLKLRERILYNMICRFSGVFKLFLSLYFPGKLFMKMIASR